MEYLETLVDRADINDLISFTGFIHTHEDVYKLAAKAKVMVLPSHEDGFNNTIREAMFMKLPIVANNVGGIPIANINKECITLSKLGDIEDLANKILLVLNNKERTAILVNNAYNEVREHYSPQGVYKLTLDMYEQVLNIDSRNNEKI
jgi:glycosyltransferase involved in cell wall biosynthesis